MVPLYKAAGAKAPQLFILFLGLFQVILINSSLVPKSDLQGLNENAVVLETKCLKAYKQGSWTAADKCNICKCTKDNKPQCTNKKCDFDLLAECIKRNKARSVWNDSVSGKICFCNSVGEVECTKNKTDQTV
ncbi:hypothetical protein AX774_g6265 [Zancudomyces culisetae]|uniref:Pacifastin domain-containing protein n=1 Tax=Zancudomyces culisetae TaxID=1213189 RepID=A0A1R1PHH1_ZANCU|nr:hypothetical protein AX774_g6265 [Zancudomyces culisetae]|eukprot:OMH80302.1 hypothetical protein AX774_g6265 [Zancudomyces culisetae]